MAENCGGSLRWYWRDKQDTRVKTPEQPRPRPKWENQEFYFAQNHRVQDFDGCLAQLVVSRHAQREDVAEEYRNELHLVPSVPQRSFSILGSRDRVPQPRENFGTFTPDVAHQPPHGAPAR